MPIGSRPTTASFRSWRRYSAAITACRLPSPPGHHDPPRRRALEHAVQLAGIGGRLDLDRARARGGCRGRAWRASSSAVPASSLVITSRGSTGRTLAETRRRPGSPGGVWSRPHEALPAPMARAGVTFPSRRRSDARDRGPRSPVGRRGQGEGHRPARHHRVHRLRRPHQRWPQRRAHDRGERREVRDPPAAQRHPHARQPPR